MLPISDGDGFMQKFTHLLEEYEVRGGPNIDEIQEVRKPILRYFENGELIAVKMFSGYEKPEYSFLVKYGRREFLEPMLKEGRVRICPASFYNNQEFIDSIKDDEVTRNFFIPTFRERLTGLNSVEFQGHTIEFGNDDIVLPIVMDDYYLYSLCDHIYYRMPTDFDADAALIIINPNLFAQAVISNFLVRNTDWKPLYGPVTYYDPCIDYSKVRVPEMTKHFGYSYQREIRIALLPKTKIISSLEPQLFNIGTLESFADLVSV